MKRFSVVLALVFFAALSGKCTWGAEEGLAYNIDQIQKNLSAPERAQQQENEIYAFRDALVAELVATLRDNTKGENLRIQAARLLGIFRAAEAVPVLADNILFGPSVTVEKTPGSMRPCQQALICIGSPAAREALRRLPNETEAVRREAFCGVLRAVEGAEVAVFLLNKEIEKSSGPQKNNLEAARALIASGAVEDWGALGESAKAPEVQPQALRNSPGTSPITPVPTVASAAARDRVQASKPSEAPISSGPDALGASAARPSPTAARTLVLPAQVMSPPPSRPTPAVSRKSFWSPGLFPMLAGGIGLLVVGLLVLLYRQRATRA